MSPKEKALELRDKYFDVLEGENFHLRYFEAEKLALIAIDEIINYQSVILESFPSDGYQPNYWNEVKEEINNL